uniref:Uncharacterized protein n=1 Tax=Candidatus Kentrum sp. FW TaxID=2126338 RepID=A0A450RX41_9GAMM|nr:MAG: hypothetical protein BECKFW1821A_GA0114235_100510 [Candidatus Kentron sp. FW]
MPTCNGELWSGKAFTAGIFINRNSLIMISPFTILFMSPDPGAGMATNFLPAMDPFRAVPGLPPRSLGCIRHLLHPTYSCRVPTRRSRKNRTIYGDRRITFCRFGRHPPFTTASDKTPGVPRLRGRFPAPVGQGSNPSGCRCLPGLFRESLGSPGQMPAMP